MNRKELSLSDAGDMPVYILGRGGRGEERVAVPPRPSAPSAAPGQSPSADRLLGPRGNRPAAERMYLRLEGGGAEILDVFYHHVGRCRPIDDLSLLRHGETWFPDPALRLAALRGVYERAAADGHGELRTLTDQASVRLLSRHGRVVRASFNIAEVVARGVDAELGEARNLRRFYVETVQAGLPFWQLWRTTAVLYPRWGFEEALRFLRDAARADLRAVQPSLPAGALEAPLDHLEQLVKLADVQVRLGILMERLMQHGGKKPALGTRAAFALLVGMGCRAPLDIETLADRLGLEAAGRRTWFAERLKGLVAQLPHAARTAPGRFD